MKRIRCPMRTLLALILVAVVSAAALAQTKVMSILIVPVAVADILAENGDFILSESSSNLVVE